MVATSDSSIKFHEIWAERGAKSKHGALGGDFAGSQILQGECSLELERSSSIR